MTTLPDPFAAFRLHGRTALVTGARREIGRAIALGLAAAGATLAIHHAGTEEEARNAAGVLATIERGGGRAAAFGADFSQDGAAARLASEAIAALGAIDILVLNASIEIVQPFEAITREAFDRQVAVNLRSTLELMQALVPPMATRGWGRVLTIGSVQQAWPLPTMFVYAGSKAMQHNWAMNLARQYGPRGVTVNNLAPGAILTARNRDQFVRPEDRDAMLARVPLGRLGRPEDLVGAALLLCSDAGSYITGANLIADGGRLIA
jgi:NAD(P)-dependent dehydrogenase (short-subunit alcohol dehydrogenase family)